MRRLIVAPIGFLLASANASPTAPTVGELSQAVAEVNDWRALGIFAFAMMLLLMGLVIFAFVQMARASRERDLAEKELAKAMQAQAVAMGEIKTSMLSIMSVVARIEPRLDP